MLCARMGGVPTPTAIQTAIATLRPSVTATVTPLPTLTSTPTATPTPITYVVKAGDTLSAIADVYGVTVGDILVLNGLANPDALQIGQALLIPQSPLPPTPRPPTPMPIPPDPNTPRIEVPTLDINTPIAYPSELGVVSRAKWGARPLDMNSKAEGPRSGSSADQLVVYDRPLADVLNTVVIHHTDTDPDTSIQTLQDAHMDEKV